MFTAHQQAVLLRISDTHLTPMDPVQDIRDREVIDSNGENIGRVSDLFIDDADKRVRFVEVAAGGFMHLGETKFLIPVDAVENMDEKAVYINRNGEHIAATPKYNPQLIDQPYVDQVYQHYGYTPFYAMGYTAPVFPMYF